MKRSDPGPRRSDQTEDWPDDQFGNRHELARISRRLLALDTHEISDTVREEFESAARLARCELSLFSFLDPARLEEPRWTASWHAQGAEQVSTIATPGTSEHFDWSRSQLRAGHTIHFHDTRPLPDTARNERASFESRGVRAALVIPVRSVGQLVGVHVFERIHDGDAWSENEIATLRIVGEMLVSALRRESIEAALRESEERFRTIAEQATELVAEFDAHGRFCYASPSYEALLGYRPEDLLGTPSEKLIHPDDNSDSRTRFARSFEKSVPSHSLHRLRNKSGAWRWFQNSGRAYRRADGQRRFVSIGHDVTERVEAERVLERQLDLERRVARLSQRLLGVVDDSLGQEIVDALGETAGLTNANRAYLATFPRDPTERPALHEWCADGTAPWHRQAGGWAQTMLQRGMTLDFADVDDLPPEAATVRGELKARGTTSILAIPLRRGDHTIGVIGFENGTPYRWTEHEIRMLGLIGEILTSAIQRHASLSALRESQFELMQAQKLEAIGRLAGGIAHDFNNLLTVILGLSRPMIERLPAGSELALDLTDIHEAAERAASLTRQLLTFSRRQPVEPRSVDLNATLAQVRPLLERMLGPNITLTLRPCDGPTWVRGDAHQLEQIIVNLTTNARDAMPEGGAIEIETEIRSLGRAAAAQLRLRGAGRYVVLSASDSGEGMDQRTRRRIFDPFFTTKDPGKGTGLGLSIIFSVVEQSNGAIEIESELGRGSCFRIWLPHQCEEADPEDSSRDEPARRDGTERVLFVEDEPALRRLGRRILERAGYHVVEATDGEAALALLEDGDDPIEVLVTDFVMPRMSGGELALRARLLQPTLPILFVSGHADDDADRLELDASAWLEKPFSADALLERLRELIDR